LKGGGYGKEVYVRAEQVGFNLCGALGLGSFPKDGGRFPGRKRGPGDRDADGVDQMCGSNDGFEKKGGEGMSLAGKVTMEVERLLNLSRGFGWEKQKEEIVDRQLRVTLTKDILTQEQIDGVPLSKE